MLLGGSGPREAGDDAVEVGERGNGREEPAQPAAGVLLPGSGPLAPARHVDGAVVRRQGRLQLDLPVLVGVEGEDEGGGHGEALDLDGRVEDAPAGGEHHVDVAGGRHHHRFADLVVGQPGHPPGLERPVPGGLGHRGALAQQWVVDRAVAAAARPRRRIAVPVGLALPGVGGQVHDPPGAGEEDGVPVAGAGGQEPGDGGVDGLRAGVLPAQGGHHQGGGRRAAARQPPQVAAQYGVRADLHVHVAAQLPEPLDGRGEQHGSAQVVPPVAGVELLAGEHGAGGRGGVRDVSPARLEPPQVVGQNLLQAVHGPAVERVVQAQVVEVHAVLPAVRAQPGQSGLVAADGHVAAAVDPGDLQPALVRGQQGAGPGGVRAQRGHAPVADGGRLRPGTGHDHPRRRLQVQRAGRPRRGHLAGTVPGHGGRLDAPGAQHRHQPHLHGEQQRLRHVGRVGAPTFGGRGQLGGHRPAQGRAQGLVRLPDGPSEVGVLLEQARSHAGPLGAVSGEGEGHRAARNGRRGRARGDLAGRRAAQPVRGRRRAGGQDGDPLLVRPAPPTGGVRHVVELLRPAPLEPIGHAPRRLPRRLGRPRGDDHRQRRTGGRRVGGGG